ncbi:oxaloacetate decarboxylase [Desulforhopalus sp. IMCC35007]|uniref:isocitrate lyase/PEP mutase family protein n=1 Tax=Desulforhopalus sp. IMCC35007 TaxID=2569543 RepID=UPI0010AE28C1|nr:isocitrate lyase/PEP mutase family protein [Desulforhopalus sp. IMCC35007]TKB06537.1 isocitrate lyase/PEP mutase family protein [Desulforhopalus sp. IMCC35007]
MKSSTQHLRELLADPSIITMPCCYDALSAKMIERAGFPLTFMSGFAVSAARLALPDTGLISFGEMLDQARTITRAVTFPVIGDGDTGYGNVLNVKRTVKEYAGAGLACVMIEDQVAPKRCGHTRGKEVVGFDDACRRLQAAVDAREEGADILIMARTDARATDGLDEAIRRIKAFRAIGADILFMEAPESEEEMHAFCNCTDGPKMANMLEHGKTPILPPARLEEIGFKIAAYPLTLLLAILPAIEQTLAALQRGEIPDGLTDFDHLKDVVGFPLYYQEEERYRHSK